jgi:hypothetical protein
VVLNVTSTDTSSNSYLTLWPAGAAQPLASDLNWGQGQTVSNLVIATVGANGQVTIFNATGSAAVVVDALGYYN